MAKFDEIMSFTEQEQWLQGHSKYLEHRENATSYLHRRQELVDHLLSMDYAPEVLKVLKKYIELCIPIPVKTEAEFWACSIYSKGVGESLIVRLNMAQTVFDIHEIENDLCYIWYIQKDQLENVFGSSLGILTSDYPEVELYEVDLQKGGERQLRLCIFGTDNALKLLEDQDFLRQVREFNLRVARAGVVAKSDYHCTPLIDAIFGFDEIEYLNELIDEDEKRLEGQMVERTRKERIRNYALIEEAKRKFFENHKKLFCEVCNFDFFEIYGERGRGFIEAHHSKPLSQFSNVGELTNSKSLVMLCANCHRMIHKSPFMEIEEFKNYFKSRNP